MLQWGHQLGTERCQSRLDQILKQQTNCNQYQLKLYNIRNKGDQSGVTFVQA